MTKHRENSIDDLLQKRQEIAAVDAEIQELKDLPEKMRREEEERSRTLPPSDIVTARMREKDFDDKVGRKEISNNRREVHRNLFLMVLLFATVCVMVWWAYASLKRNGIL